MSEPPGNEEGRSAKSGPLILDESDNTLGRGIIFVNSTLDDAGLDPVEFRVLAHIARRGDNRSGAAFPSIRGIAVVCRINKDTACRAINSLIEKGWLERFSRPGKASTYAIKIPATHPKPGGIRNKGVSPAFGRTHPKRGGDYLSETRGYEGYPLRISTKDDSPLKAGADAPPVGEVSGAWRSKSL